MSEYYAGVDLGGTKILTGIGDAEGRIVARSRARTEVEKGEKRIVKNIVHTIHRALEKAELER